MPKYYLRVDAANINNFVYDTHDISTIRGGSFLLLDAIESLRDQFKDRLIPIATAASQGLFLFEPSEENPKQACQALQIDVLKHLGKVTDGHATFLIAIQEEIPNEFSKVLEKLESQIHRQQWRMPTVAIPKPTTTAQECHLDGWRPGVQEYPYAPDKFISQATAYRRVEGIRLKRRFFTEILSDNSYASVITSKDLGRLAKDDSKGNLNGKIALIHIDGNSFGRIRRKLCQIPDDRAGFDNAIQNTFRREAFLKALFELATEDPDFQTKDDEGNPALRLEVLLWGGDEMTLVVPAWQGWRVMRLFYEKARALNFKGTPLSQRAALIFCHHNAPILLIRQLAEDLLGVTKEDIQARLGDHSQYQALKPEEKENLKTQLTNHELGDALHYLVLESFDLLRGDIRQFLDEYYRGAAYANLLVYSGEIKELLGAIHTIQAGVSRGKALQVLEALQQNDQPKVKATLKDVFDLVTGKDRERVKIAVNFLTKDMTCLERWYLAADLWDYVSEGDFS